MQKNAGPATAPRLPPDLARPRRLDCRPMGISRGIFRAEGQDPVVVGHRGAPLVAAENTAEAFAAAAGLGATWVELDARRAADGVVVRHDPHTAGGVALIEARVEELAALGIPSLDTVLAGLPEGLGVDVELKNLPGEPDYDEGTALADAVAGVLAAHHGRPLLASSFNPSTLAGLAGTGLPLGLLTSAWVRLDAAVGLAGELGAVVLCPHVDSQGLDEAGIAAAHAAGLQLMAWTVDDPDRARRLAVDGIDALCTNDPARILAAVRPPR